MKHYEASHYKVHETGSQESLEEAAAVDLAYEALEARGAAQTWACGEVGARVRDLSAHVVDGGGGTHSPQSERRNRWNESEGLHRSISVQEPSSVVVQRAVEGTREVILGDRGEKAAGLGGGVEQDYRSPERWGVGYLAQSTTAFAQQRKGIVGQVEGVNGVHLVGKGGMGWILSKNQGLP